MFHRKDESQARLRMLLGKGLQPARAQVVMKLCEKMSEAKMQQLLDAHLGSPWLQELTSEQAETMGGLLRLGAPAPLVHAALSAGRWPRGGEAADAVRRAMEEEGRGEGEAVAQVLRLARLELAGKLKHRARKALALCEGEVEAAAELLQEHSEREWMTRVLKEDQIAEMKTLHEMGFSDYQAIYEALTRCGWDSALAVNRLLAPATGTGVDSFLQLSGDEEEKTEEEVRMLPRKRPRRGLSRRDFVQREQVDFPFCLLDELEVMSDVDEVQVDETGFFLRPEARTFFCACMNRNVGQVENCCTQMPDLWTEDAFALDQRGMGPAFYVALSGSKVVLDSVDPSKWRTEHWGEADLHGVYALHVGIMAAFAAEDSFDVTFVEHLVSLTETLVPSQQRDPVLQAWLDFARFL